MESRSRSFEEFTKSFNYFDYDAPEYEFKELLQKILNFRGSLEKLHESDLAIEHELTHNNDQNSVVHRKYYDSAFYNIFVEKYREFVRREVLPLFKEKSFAVQSEPTFRCCMPDNTAVGRLAGEKAGAERIGYHRDGDFNHPASEINFVLCLTDMHDSNGFHFETSADSGNFQPVDMTYGKFFQFYGNKLWHFNKKNVTGKTRISVDFRIIPMSQYDESEMSTSIHQNRKFTLGGYYMKMEK
eukprot:228222_1